MIIKGVADMAEQRAVVAQSGGHWADKFWVPVSSLGIVW